METKQLLQIIAELQNLMSSLLTIFNLVNTHTLNLHTQLTELHIPQEKLL